MYYNQQNENELYLSLGSNLGDRVYFLNKAIELLKETFNTSVISSSIYESKSWGYESNSSYLNVCVKLEVSLSPIEILKKTQEIENKLGRKRDKSGKYIDRTIDIDILLYGNKQINTKKIKIPHPQICNRNFVLSPLLEIAPNLTEPNTKRSFKELKKECNDKTIVLLYSN